MPTTYRRRAIPCSHCGDVVLISETRLGKILGATIRRDPVIGQQHADPGPADEVFDGVDDACRRPRVAG